MSLLQNRKEAFARYIRGKDTSNVELMSLIEEIFNAGWHAALSTHDKEKELLELIAKHATGICIGLDWNSGAAANKHRGNLEQAVKQLAELRDEV